MAVGTLIARYGLAAIFAGASLAHWVTRFAQVDCCVTPVARLEEAMLDAQFAARGMVPRMPDGSPTFGAPFRITGNAPSFDAPAPAHGQHTREILREAGYDDAAIAALGATGAISAGRA